jgi:polysaccharide export outer membrane protein
MSPRRLFGPGILAFLAACGAPEGRPASVPVEAARPFLSAAPPPETGTIPKIPPPAAPALVAGDILSIHVYQQADLTLEVRVPPAGTFTYPLIGPVEAAGRTTASVEKDIRDRLAKDYLHNPSVTVTVKEYAKRMIYILGGVQKPGCYEMSARHGMTLLQLVATAEGFTDRARKEYAQVVRRREREREVIRLSIVDIEKLVARGRPEADVELQPDDLVVVPSAARVVYVLGQVKNPSSFPLPVDTRVTVSMAISQAGSWTKFASTSRIQVLRQPPTGEPQKFTVDLDEVMEGKLDKDVELHPGDIIWVPERGIF